MTTDCPHSYRKREPKPPGFFERVKLKAAKVWSYIDPVATKVLHGVVWGVPKLARLTWKTVVVISCKKNEAGTRHFDAKYCSLNLVKIAGTAFLLVALITPTYYYGTWSTYRDIYIPSSGVFVNEQFVHPSGPGQVIAPRDEVFTVLGKEFGPNGQLEPVRFDIDFNVFFFFYQDAMRPDLAASKLDSQSPYGIKVTVEATGLYNRLPRFIRIVALKWWDLRPEIVKIVSVDELKALPDGFKDTSR